MAYAKIQNQDPNKTLGGGEMTGDTEAQGGANQINTSTSGTPGGFTNIQDYMGANKGDTTNQNYLNTKADEQINNAVGQMNTAVSALSPINTQAASIQGLNDLLNQNDYTKAREYATTPNFTPTAQELPDIANPTSNLKGTLPDVMSYIGEIKPQSQQYTGGMQKFDEMLLGADPTFPGQFAANKQQQYETQVEDPYGAAKAAREGQKAQATQNAADWKTQMQNYLGGEDKTIQGILANQQEQEKKKRNTYMDERISESVQSCT